MFLFCSDFKAESHELGSPFRESSRSVGWGAFRARVWCGIRFPMGIGSGPMPDVLSVIRAERQELERQLQADPRHLKIKHLLELEALYTQDERTTPAAREPLVPSQVEDATPVPEVPVKPWPSTAAFHSRGTGKVVRRIKPERIRVLEQAANVIRGRAKPTKTADIFDALADEDRALIKGDNPQGNLSAMLHHSPAFVSHGRVGWTLAQADPSYVAVADLVEVAQDVEQQREGFTFTP